MLKIILLCLCYSIFSYSYLNLIICFGFLSGTPARPNPVRVRKPTPWAYGNRPLSSAQLQEMRNTFWQNAVQAGGRQGDFHGKFCYLKDQSIKLAISFVNFLLTDYV